MKRVFIGGSRHFNRLNDDIRRRLDRIIERQLHVLIGDANGADKAVQSYLNDHAYRDVVVFCTGGECRNNIGGWQVRSVDAPHKVKDFAYYSSKDMVMAHEADAGFMLWDGESIGTVVNIARMLSAGKTVSVYVSPEKSFYSLKTPEDLKKILSACKHDVKMRLDRYIIEHAQEYTQPMLFR